jgi:hypothetical protein
VDTGFLRLTAVLILVRLAGNAPIDVPPLPSKAEIASMSLLVIGVLCFFVALIVGVAAFAIRSIKKNRAK